MTYITGDTNGNFDKFKRLELTNEDIVIIVGNADINTDEIKKELNNLNFKLFCISENNDNYDEVSMFDGIVYVDKNYPNIIYAKNGSTYNINGKSILVINSIENELINIVKGKSVDYVVTNTCPYKYIPEKRIENNNEMEKYLDKIEENITYNKWFCGHFHIEKSVDKFEFMFGRIKNIETNELYPTHEFYTGYELVRDFCKKEDYEENWVCPKCNSNNIIVLKGNGENIIGNDSLGIICNQCKKVYCFSDVLYKENCPREI